MKFILLSALGVFVVLGLVNSFAAQKPRCNKRNCKFGGRCTCIGRYQKCKCSFWCPRLPFWKYVCGSDGTTYRNRCELSKRQCKQQKRIALVKYGQCNKPCPDDQIARCFVRPCQVTTCPAFPKATCLDNYCRGCHAEFYYRGRRVNCNLLTPLPPCPMLRCLTGEFGNLLDKNGCRTCTPRKICSDGKPPVTCRVSPCLFSRCPQYPTAQCETDNCDRSCRKANFFVKSRKIDCADLVPTKNCATKICRLGEICKVENGKAECKHPAIKTCAAVLCRQGYKCVIRNGEATCKKPCESSRDCSQQGSYCQSGFCECSRFCIAVVSLDLCGSDGMIYNGQCAMNNAACQKNTEIKSVPFSYCKVKGISSCAAILCGFGSTCQIVKGKAVCSTPGPTTCAALTCFSGSVCVEENGIAICKKSNA